MKLKIFAPKRLAVATCVLAVASLGAAAIVFTQARQTPVSAAAARPVNGAGNGQPALKRLETQRTSQLERYAESLAALLGPRTPPEVDLALLFELPAPATVSRREPAYTVSMVWRSGEEALALIDSRLYRVGDRLPDGARIARVEPDAVWLELRGQRRKIELSGRGRTASPGIVELSFHAAD